MITVNGETVKLNRAAQKMVWLYGAQWRNLELNQMGIDEEELTEDMRAELMEQLNKQEQRVRGLFGV